MGTHRRFDNLTKYCEWYFSRDQEYCSHCKKIHKDSPPCDNCKWGEKAAPHLSPFEREVFDIYLMISNQVRTSFGGVVGLDYNVLFSLFDILGIDMDDRLMYFNGIRVIESYYLKSLDDKRRKMERQVTQADSNTTKQLIPKSISGKR